MQTLGAAIVVYILLFSGAADRWVLGYAMLSLLMCNSISFSGTIVSHCGHTLLGGMIVKENSNSRNWTPSSH